MRTARHMALGVVLLVAPPLEARWTTSRAHVSGAGLDLRTAEGTAALNARVLSAARELCRRSRDYNFSSRHLPDRRCLRNALADSAAQVRALVDAQNAVERVADRSSRFATEPSNKQ